MSLLIQFMLVPKTPKPHDTEFNIKLRMKNLIIKLRIN